MSRHLSQPEISTRIIVEFEVEWVPPARRTKAWLTRRLFESQMAERDDAHSWRADLGLRCFVLAVSVAVSLVVSRSVHPGLVNRVKHDADDVFPLQLLARPLSNF